MSDQVLELEKALAAALAELNAARDRIAHLETLSDQVGRFAEAEDAARRSSEFSRLAERLARVGTWNFDVARQEITWSAETALFHEDLLGTPSLSEGIGYCIPEDRSRMQSAISECVADGRSYDEIFQIVTAKGRKAWVRSIGEPVRNASGQIVAVQGAFQDVSEVMAARDEAAALSARLAYTLQNLSDAFIILDKEWRYSFVNAEAERLLSRSRDDLVGKVIWDEFPEGPGWTYQAVFEQAVSSGQPARFKLYYPEPLNTWFEISANPTPAGLQVYFRDITSEHHKTEHLRLLESAVSHLNDMLIITEAEPIDGPDGPRIIYVNDAFEKRTGYSRAEVIGKTPRLLQGPKTQRHELARIRRFMEKWQPVRAELINYTKSGEEFWLELDIVPLADEQGRFTHWVAIERDISDRKKADQELHINAERFRLVTKAARNAIWECDLNDGSHWYSVGLKDIFGHDPEQDRAGKDVWEENIHPADAARVAASLERLKSGSQDILLEQYGFRCADGTWTYVEDRAFAIRDDEGRAVRILGSMTDISERVQLQNRLRHSEKMEALGQLTGGIAHDFNNLLTIMMGNAEALTDELTDWPHLHRMAKMTVDAAERGAEMTDRLLAFSRKQALEPRVLDLGQLVQGLDSLLRRTLPENIDIEVIRGGGLWNVELDAGQLEAAVLNLVLNARDAMPGGGCLTIEMANCTLDDNYVFTELDVKPGQYVMLVVTDTGHGIPQDVIGRVFEPFFTTKDVGKGSGLGLSMAYGFVKQSGGHIRVYSEIGEGTAFKLYFPRSIGKDEQTNLHPSTKKIAGGHEVILVVEDDKMVREYVVTQLNSLGYRIIEAASGTEALEVMKRGSGIHLLFTDVVMPGGMGGRALADAARAINPDIKVLFTSGYTENSIVHGGRLDPGVQLLSKPYRREQLALKVRKVLSEE